MLSRILRTTSGFCWPLSSCEDKSAKIASPDRLLKNMPIFSFPRMFVKHPARLLLMSSDEDAAAGVVVIVVVDVANVPDALQTTTTATNVTITIKIATIAADRGFVVSLIRYQALESTVYLTWVSKLLLIIVIIAPLLISYNY